MSLDYRNTTTQERALLRAVTQLVQTRYVGDGKWWTDSSTTPGMVYVTTVDGCDCPAGQAERYCKHRAAVAMYLEQHTCAHCGHNGADVDLDSKNGQYYCIDRQSCWTRFDAAHGLGA